jgi:DNA-binding winged helix-turn-helix (wHTH) protein/tetratricopeptide (TPR) repeat protein/TolB-like protein
MSTRDTEVTNGRRRLDEVSPSEHVHDTRPLAFGSFVMDPESGRLWEGGRASALPPKPFETLLYLARRSGRVVSKTELIEKLWPGTFVTDDVLVQSIVEVRKALGDHARTPVYIQTVPRRGYQFLVGVQVLDALPAPAPLDIPEPAAAPEVPAPESEPALPPATEPAVAMSAPPPRPWAPYVLGALLMAAAAAAALWFTRPRPAPDPPSLASPQALQPGSLLVLPVVVQEPTPESEWLREGLAEMVRSQLGQTPGLEVVARHRLAAALQEGGADAARAPEGALRLARQLRAERMVTGSFLLVGEQFVVNAEVVEVASGRTEGSASARGRMPVDLLDAVDELCLELLHQLTPTSRPGGGRLGPVRLTTRSVEASRHYMEALGRFARGGRQGAVEAEALLDQALKLDATFAQAYLKKAEIQQWRRRWGYGNPDPTPAVRAAARLMKELPNREMVLVESFEALILRQQPAVALTHWNALLQFYPTYAQEVGVPGLAADTLMMQGRWDELILMGEAHVDSPSLPDAERARVSSLLAQAFRRKGEFERALRHAQRAVRLWPTPQGPGHLGQRAVLGRIALDSGRRREALEEFRAVAGSADADVPNLVNAAWGLYMAEETAEAGALIERALALDPTYGNAYHLRGWMALASADYARAASDLLTAFELTPPAFGSTHHGLVNGDLAALYYAGVAYLKAGESLRGRATLERLVAHCRQLVERRRGEPVPAADWQTANFTARALSRLGHAAPQPARLEGDDTTYFVQSARLHAVQGRLDDALRELAQGIALGHGELRHIQDDPDFESLHGQPEFERLVAGR